jgi:hypothetical protein
LRPSSEAGAVLVPPFKVLDGALADRRYTPHNRL